ncbi:UNVERIFIED_ORG: hypothetical protein ABIC54_001265 [Burkholderia sp. 1263]
MHAPACSVIGLRFRNTKWQPLVLKENGLLG